MAVSQSSLTLRWRLGGMNAPGAALGQPLAQFVAVIALVGNQLARRRQCRDTVLGNPHIVRVSGGQQQNPRPSLPIADGVELGVSTAAGLADTMGQGPPFAPPAVRWTLMQLLSINNLSGASSVLARA